MKMSDQNDKRAMQKIAESLAPFLDEVNREIVNVRNTANGFVIAGSIAGIAGSVGAIVATAAIPFTGGVSSAAIPWGLGLSAAGCAGSGTSLVAQGLKAVLTEEKMKKAADMWKVFCAGMEEIINLENPGLRIHFFKFGLQVGCTGVAVSAILSVRTADEALSAAQAAFQAAKGEAARQSAKEALKAAAKGAAQASKLFSVAMAGSLIMNAIALGTSYKDLMQAAGELSDVNGNGPLSQLSDRLREFAQHGDIGRAFGKQHQQ